ncbi:DUF1330 domain-containing protein [Acuticoccus kandeliae]|uniref:DUF1330 domain-containing protein n=1 Tax=Acuticoccus kandeliae TaxID=2073160 RepID=UPI000D3EDFB9|nr:DUF1330 domain-containing protein [Acuticoccus kandeliae]
MPKGYWIAHVDVDDEEGYKEYIGMNAEPITRHGGRFLVRGGRFEGIEGTKRARNVIIEFPSYQAALDCMNSEAYQAALAVRRKYSKADVIVIEGYEGPQPGE